MDDSDSAQQSARPDHLGRRAYCVIAEGTSMRLTQRDDYASFLARNNGDVEALIAALRRQAAEG
jgi:phospholipid transport system substrate-binding protein